MTPNLGVISLESPGSSNKQLCGGGAKAPCAESLATSGDGRNHKMAVGYLSPPSATMSFALVVRGAHVLHVLLTSRIVLGCPSAGTPPLNRHSSLLCCGVLCAARPPACKVAAKVNVAGERSHARTTPVPASACAPTQARGELGPAPIAPRRRATGCVAAAVGRGS